MAELNVRGGVRARGQLSQALDEVEGSQLVEFALCIPILLAVFFAAIYFAYVMFAAHFVTNAVNDGARYAMVRGSDWKGNACQSASTVECSATSADVSRFVATTMPAGLSPGSLSVSTTWPGTTPSGGNCDTQNGTNSRNCTVIVQATYVVAFPLPYVNSRSMTISSTAEMTIAQ